MKKSISLYLSLLSLAAVAFVHADARDALKQFIVDTYQQNTRHTLDSLSMKSWLEKLLVGNVRTFNEPITAITVSPNGKYLMVQGDDQHVFVLDSTTWQKVKDFGAGVDRFEFSKNSEYVYVVFSDGRATLYAIRSWDSVINFDGVFGSGIEISPDNKLASVVEKNRVYVFDIQTDKIVKEFGVPTFPLRDRGWLFSMDYARFSPDGKYILVGVVDETAALYSTATWEKILEFEPNDIMMAEFNPNGQEVLVGYRGRGDMVYSLKTFLPVFSGGNRVTYSNDGNYASVHAQDRAIEIYKTGSWARVANVGKNVELVFFSSDSTYAIVIYLDGNWDIYRVRDWQKIRSLGDNVRTLELSPNSRYIWIKYDDGTSEVRETAHWLSVATFIDEVQPVVFGPEGNYLLFNQNRELKKLYLIYHFFDEELIHMLED